MPKQQVTNVDAVCPKCGSREFQLRLLKDEGIGAATCMACSRNYLLLDSADHWFDVIQQGYPRTSRCSCRSESFHLRFEYEYRNDGDIQQIDAWSTCAACGKSRRAMRIEIDYSPTAKLVRRPLTYCRNLKTLYNLHELTLYATKADIIRVVHFLADDQRCELTGWLQEKNQWVQRRLDADGSKRAIMSDRYQMIYAMPVPITIPEEEVETARKEDRFWKRSEVIRIGSHISMVWGSRTGRLYYVHFSNEFVERGRVTPKSAKFQRATGAFVRWLKAEFVTWRGVDCFDNPSEHMRLFGDRFRR
jgi:hypothetical protein